MSLRTLNDVFLAAVERRHPKVMLQRREDVWEPVSSETFAAGVAGVAGALRRFGIGHGDRVAILSENRPEWMIADFASLLLGAVTVPIYATLTAEQTAHILRDSGARVIFLSTEIQLQKVLSIREQTPVEKVVVMDAVENPGAVRMQDLGSEVRQSSLRPSSLRQSSLLQSDERDPQLEASARAIGPDDLATIIYTSGTTGAPKGVMLTHGNIASNLSCSLRGFDMHPGLISISFLPLSHVT